MCVDFNEYAYVLLEGNEHALELVVLSREFVDLVELLAFFPDRIGHGQSKRCRAAQFILQFG